LKTDNHANPPSLELWRHFFRNNLEANIDADVVLQALQARRNVSVQHATNGPSAFMLLSQLAALADAETTTALASLDRGAFVLQEVYYSPNLNSGKVCSGTTMSSNVSCILDPKQPARFVSVVAAVFQTNVGYAALESLCIRGQSSKKTPRYQTANSRHLVQQDAILDHLRHRNLLPSTQHGGAISAVTYVEFGCGRGMLALALNVVLPQSHIILIDRARMRMKADGEMRRTKLDLSSSSTIAFSGAATVCKLGSFARVTVDIRHLALARVSALSGRSVVVATDLTLNCLGNVRRNWFCHQRRSTVLSPLLQCEPKVLGGAIALCCGSMASIRERNFSLAPAFGVLKHAVPWP
jgi:hypothetical protein